MAERSLWLEEALALPGEVEAPRLEGEQTADVVVVGGGYTGLWTALRLKEHDPGLDVAVLEADVCGGGPSGRNGGFVMSWWSKFGTLEKSFGAEEALTLARATDDAVTHIGTFCDAQGIDAHYRKDGWLWTATSAAQLGAWEGTLAAIERHGVQAFERWSPEQVAERGGTPALVAGVFEPSCATVQPALLARGLRRVALDQGVRIFERSPMRRLERTRPARVHAILGAITAERVVLALNAWLVQVRELSRSMAVIASDMVATEPAPERLAEIGFADGVAVSDSRLLVNYWRTTLDGRIAFGQGGGALARGGKIGKEFSGSSPRAAGVADTLRRFYPTLADLAVPSSWTGPIDRSKHGLPFFGRLGGRPDIVYGGGYSGNGVGPAYLGGRILASLALDLADEWASSPLARGANGGFPPEPIRYPGGLLVREAVARKERAEDAGKRPGRIATRVAGLAPAGLVPTKK